MATQNNANSVGKMLSKLRTDKGLTQEQLAKELNVTDKAISKWETEKGNPSQDFLPAIAKFFGVSIDYLMSNNPTVELSDLAKQSLKNKEKVKFKVEDYLEEGVLNIDKLLETRNLEFIKKSLNNHPIHLIELIKNKRQGKIRDFFELALDNNLQDLAGLIVTHELTDEKFDKFLLNIWLNESLCLNKKHFFLTRREGKDNIREDFAPFRSYYNSYSRNQPKLEDVMEKLSLCRKRIIEECALQYNKDEIINKYTKEYFEELIVKDDIKSVVIDLCIRLEAILHCDYHYDGDLKDMLNSYCDNVLTWKEDDGWGYYNKFQDNTTISALNKLRQKRNNIVHHAQTAVDLTLEEIKYCVKYICKMG